jgi:hypothetical protein
MSRGSNSSRSKQVFPPTKRPDRLWGPVRTSVQCILGFFLTGKAAATGSWSLTSIRCRGSEWVDIPSWRRRGKLYVLPSILILSCNIHCGFESGRYPTAATHQYNTQTTRYMQCQPQTHREIKAAKSKPVQGNVAEIIWMRKHEQYTRNTRSRAFAAAQLQAYHACYTSSKWFLCLRLCLCTNN